MEYGHGIGRPGWILGFQDWTVPSEWKLPPSDYEAVVKVHAELNGLKLREQAAVWSFLWLQTRSQSNMRIAYKK